MAGEGETVVTVTAAALKPYDRFMAAGAHWASPTDFPQVVGADGVGRLADGTRVAFFGPRRPYGGMAERALVRSGVWFELPDDVDDVTAAAFTNPGMAAWKTVLREGALAPGQTVLALGATGASGRIAAQLAVRHGARVVVAGRDRAVLDRLLALGAAAAVRVDRPHAELTAALAAEGPYDLVVDYLWGAPAEAALAALSGTDLHARTGPEQIRYLLVGMAAGEVAGLRAVTLRSAPVRLIGSGTGEQPPFAEVAAAWTTLVRQAAAGEILLDVDPVPLADVEKVWPHPSSDRRTVFLP